jgi:hypothetical protein
MPKTIDLEREFFKVAKDVETYKEVKVKLSKRMREILEDFMEYKQRQDILGLQEKKKDSELNK